MIRETYRAESIARERAIAHFINGLSGQSLVNAVIVEVESTRKSIRGLVRLIRSYSGVANSLSRWPEQRTMRKSNVWLETVRQDVFIENSRFADFGAGAGVCGGHSLPCAG